MNLTHKVLGHVALAHLDAVPRHGGALDLQRTVGSLPDLHLPFAAGCKHCVLARSTLRLASHSNQIAGKAAAEVRGK